MVDVDELRILVTGDTRQFESSLRNADSRMDGLGHRARGVSGSMASGFRTAALAVTGVATAGAIAGASLGVKLAGELQQSRIAFTTLLGDAGRADAFLRDLAAFAAKTPFDFEGAQDGARRLLAMGFAAGDVIPMMTSIGDAVSAVGGDTEMFRGVTVALSQMQSKGKVMSQEMLQLAERGIPAWDLLAKKLGTDIPTAMKMVERGTVSAATFLSAFQTGVAERFGGAMERQSATFLGQLSTLRDDSRIFLGEMFTPLVDSLARSLPEIKAGVAEIAATFGGADLQTKVKVAFESAGPAIVEALGAAKEIADEVQPIATPAFAGLFDGMREAWDQLKIQLAPLAEIWENIKGPLAELGRIVGPVLVKAFETWGKVMGPVTKLLGAVTDLLGPLLPLLIDVSHFGFNVLATAIGFVADKLNIVLGWVKNLTQLLSPLVEAFANIGREILQGLINGMMQKWEDVKATVAAWGEGIKQSFVDIFSIRSPSRVFMQYGADVARGFELGIQNAGLTDFRLETPRFDVPQRQSATAGAVTVNLGGVTLNVSGTENGQRVGNDAVREIMRRLETQARYGALTPAGGGR